MTNDGPSTENEEGNPESDRPTSADSADWPSGVHRRQYLQAIGAAGLLGLGANNITAASGDTGPTVEITEADEENWEQAADERIREHRTAALAVTIADTHGRPLDGDVTVEMQEHAYGFGTAVNASTLIEETAPGDNYREYIPKLFNKAVIENQHKWRFWEADTALADAATEWILDQGLSLRGHVCLWANVSAWAVPPDVVKAMGMEWEANGVTEPELDPEYVRQRTFEHLREIIEHYGDQIEEWEVHNETIHRPEFIQAINGSDPDESGMSFDDRVTAPVLAEWYQAAAEAVPDGVPLAVNDYNTLAGPHRAARDAYEKEIEFLQNEGVDLGGVGMQCHFSENQQLTPAMTLEGLNTYATYGAKLKVTEFDTADRGWDPEEKGEFLYRFLKTVYSHPATSDFLMWGFWDGRHWKNDAPLFTEDWSKKPAYDAYTDLVLDQWWTDESGPTDGGSFTSRVFLGDHEVTVRLDDRDLHVRVSVDDPTSKHIHFQAIDVGRRNRSQFVPIRLASSGPFDVNDLELDTVRLGSPAAVQNGEGSAVRRTGNGPRSADHVLYVDAAAISLDGPLLLHGETEDGTTVVGFDR